MNTRPSRQLFTLSAMVGILASVAALWFQQNDFDPVDRVLLPGIGVVWLVLVVAVHAGWVRLRWAQLVLFLAYSVYFLLALNQQFRAFAPTYHRLSQSTYWFAPLYAAAFLFFLPARAIQLSTTVFAGSVLVTLGNLLVQPALLQDDLLVASILQFMLVSVTMILLQFVMGQRHDSMMAVQLAAYQDVLTGCANRRAGEEKLLTLQQNGESFTLALFDLDYFKRINDQHGHAVGDAVLRAVVQEAQRMMPTGTLCVRWGGEEFLLILPALPDTEINDSLEQFRRRLPELRVGNVSGITASFGVARRIPPEFPDQLLHRADMALYEAKAMGRNRIQYSHRQGFEQLST